MPVRTLGIEGGWIVRPRVGWGGEQNILYKSVEISLQQTRFKNLQGKPESESPNKAIYVSGGLGRLHFLS